MITVKGFEPTFSVFPNGEYNVTLSKSLIDAVENPKDLKEDIRWHFDSNDELIKMGILISALETTNVDDLTIYMGYLPYSRMDRHEPQKNNPFSLKVFMNMLPTSEKIHIEYIFHDVHNLDVTTKIANGISYQKGNVAFYLNENVVINSLEELSYMGDIDSQNTLIILPDKGSLRRYKTYIDEKNNGVFLHDVFGDGRLFDLALGYKERDFDTHKIVDFGIKSLDGETEIEFSKYSKFVIIDDIVSYGNTFINLLNYLGDNGAQESSVFLVTGNVEDSLWRGDLLDNKYLKQVITSSNHTHRMSNSQVIVKNIQIEVQKEGKND